MKRAVHRPSLSSLETLCWIARLGSFTAAAERVHTTQSTVSSRMKELETSLGVAIFQHSKRRTELTIEGRRIVRRAELLLEEADRFALLLGENVQPSGVLRVGLGELSVTLFADLIVQMQGELPGISYELDMDLAVNVRHKLDLGILDLIIVNGRLEHANLRTILLGSTRYVWVMSPILSMRGRRRATKKELLRDSPLWCISRPSTAYALTTNSLRAHGANLDNVNTCSRVLAMVEIVARGGGVALLPESIVADRIKRNEMMLLPDVAAVPIELTMACRRSQRQPLIDHIMQTVLKNHDSVLRAGSGNESARIAGDTPRYQRIKSASRHPIFEP